MRNEKLKLFFTPSHSSTPDRSDGSPGALLQQSYSEAWSEERTKVPTPLRLRLPTDRDLDQMLFGARCLLRRSCFVSECAPMKVLVSNTAKSAISRPDSGSREPLQGKCRQGSLPIKEEKVPERSGALSFSEVDLLVASFRFFNISIDWRWRTGGVIAF
ncbi:hypothetical protein KCU61_g248, partial [Aureobasidium melanogenum]